MVLLAISYLLNVVDYIFTMFWVSLYGIGAEANPYGRWMLESGSCGFIKIVVMAGLFALLGFLVKKRPRAKSAIHIVFATYCLITVYHITLALYLL